jgi:hypothetical protein
VDGKFLFASFPPLPRSSFLHVFLRSFERQTEREKKIVLFLDIRSHVFKRVPSYNSEASHFCSTFIVD